MFYHTCPELVELLYFVYSRNEYIFCWFFVLLFISLRNPLILDILKFSIQNFLEEKREFEKSAMNPVFRNPENISRYPRNISPKQKAELPCCVCSINLEIFQKSFYCSKETLTIKTQTAKDTFFFLKFKSISICPFLFVLLWKNGWQRWKSLSCKIGRASWTLRRYLLVFICFSEKLNFKF